MALIKKHIWNLIFVVLVCITLSKQIPVWQNSIKQENQIFTETEVLDLNGDEVFLPIKNKKKIYIFWATLCSPCHMQMNFFRKAITAGKINKEDVIAVSLSEELKVVREFQKTKLYPFKILVSKRPIKNLNVLVTPSIAYVDETGEIVEFTAGIAPLAVYKSQNFLK